jgi:hypothetical protein
MASQAIHFHKVTSLPGILQPDSLYFVANGTIAETYITDNAGVAKSVGNSAMINALITQQLAGYNTIDIVADIAARDALNTRDFNFIVLVVNATADTTVQTGAALYAFRNSDNTFIKIAEYESMDVTLQWSNIVGRPTSAVADIDDAVTKRHTHANKVQLDKIGEDVNGDLTYNGNSIAVFNTNNW